METYTYIIIAKRQWDDIYIIKILIMRSAIFHISSGYSL